MEENKTLSQNVGDLLALCHILDDYDDFNSKLFDLISVQCNRDIIYDLGKISRNGVVFNSKKVKRFYLENKNVIDTINKYSSINMFICSNYDTKGHFYSDSVLMFFYQYLLSNRDKLEQIILLLEKIRELGFNKIEFDESEKFDEVEYTVDTSYNGHYGDVVYLDNIKVIPNYNNNVVRYTTTGSNYRITTEVSYGHMSKHGNTIKVNSLLFDYKRLPEDITKEVIFDRIIELKKEQKEKCTIIRNSVNLSVGIDDLYEQFNSTSNIIDKLDGIKNKDELNTTLLEIKEHLDMLKALSVEYDDSVSLTDDVITKEKLQKEKKLFLEKRDWDRMDLYSH